MLTLQQLLDQVYLVWGEQHDPRLDATQVVNSAGRTLFNCHSWRWRQRPVASLSLVANQQYVELPGDFGFGEIFKVTMTESLNFGDPEPTDLGHIETLRQQATPYTPQFYWYALAYPTQSSSAASPGQPRLEIYPTPVANDADAMKLNYRSGWVELSSNTDVANVPSFMESILIRLVQAYAAQRHPAMRAERGIEKPEDVLTSEEMKSSKRSDGASQSDIGRIEGGILQHPHGYGPHLNWEVTHPS